MYLITMGGSMSQKQNEAARKELLAKKEFYTILLSKSDVKEEVMSRLRKINAALKDLENGRF